MEKINNKVFLDVRGYKSKRDLSVCAIALIKDADDKVKNEINLVLEDFYNRLEDLKEDSRSYKLVLSELYDYLFCNKYLGILLGFSNFNYKDRYISKLLENLAFKLNIVLGKNTEETRNYLVITPRIKERKNFKSKFRKSILVDGKITKSKPMNSNSLSTLLKDNFKYVRMGAYPIRKDGNITYLSWAAKMVNLAFGYLESNSSEKNERELDYITAIMPYITERTFLKNNIYKIEEMITDEQEI